MLVILKIRDSICSNLVKSVIAEKNVCFKQKHTRFKVKKYLPLCYFTPLFITAPNKQD